MKIYKFQSTLYVRANSMDEALEVNPEDAEMNVDTSKELTEEEYQEELSEIRD